jgi:hypothetical protein
VVVALTPHCLTGRTATDVLSSPLSQSSSRIAALSVVSARVVDSRDRTLDITQNRAHFGRRARSGSSFAGDVSPELCVVRNENDVSDRSITAITDAMTTRQHAIASFELHVPPRRRM